MARRDAELAAKESIAPMEDQGISDLLAGFGFTGEAEAAALAAMVEAGLTRGGKSRIAVVKVPKVEALLEERFVLICGREKCREVAAAALGRAWTPRPGGAAAGAGTVKTIVAGAREFCTVCAGSENARAVREMAEAMVRANKKRLLIIGGTPRMKKELAALLPQPCEARFVFADEYMDSKRADANAKWADLIVVWSSTPIPHKQTVPYKPYRPMTINRRGLAALADGVIAAVK